ncbi:hypothetical protein C8Q75DRAFT_758475 [Abortiporus biennis]|nr:hypothetical protein C8Q75DRAFT_758475 [Abortiporus biennis]
MEQGAKKLLETSIYSTLHANQFSRSSTQATNILADLLSRYLLILSSTCARYATHAGRLRMTAKDAVSALEELGVDVEELSQFVSGEGRDMAIRYGVHTQRRLEDMAEFRASLAMGLREDKDDVIPLVYAEVPEDIMSSDEEELDQEISESESESAMDEDLSFDTHDYFNPPIQLSTIDGESMDVDSNLLPRKEPPPPILTTSNRHTTPPLPLSPISNPSSPKSVPRPRKRARTAKWSPPPHIPSFLPPFPNESTPRPTPTPPPEESSQIKPDPDMPIDQDVSMTQAVAGPSEPAPAPVATSSSADYLTPIPYTLSNLSSYPPSHLPPPKPPSCNAASRVNPQSLPTPSTQQSLFAAYHHVLTHPPPSTLSTPNLGRYKVALAIVRHSESNAGNRWDPAPTLYGETAPNVPRVTVMGPSFPVPIARSLQGEGARKDSANGDGDVKLPGPPPKSVGYNDKIVPTVNEYVSKIPGISRNLLSGSVYNRTTRLAHPPVLTQSGKKLTYGNGVNAPWNVGPTALPTLPTSSFSQTASNPTLKDKESKDGKDKDKDKEPARILPDARMFATWDWEQKNYAQPLVVSRRRMSSMSSIHHHTNGVGVSISLSGLGRGRDKG